MPVAGNPGSESHRAAKVFVDLKCTPGTASLEFQAQHQGSKLHRIRINFDSRNYRRTHRWYSTHSPWYSNQNGTRRHHRNSGAKRTRVYDYLGYRWWTSRAKSSSTSLSSSKLKLCISPVSNHVKQICPCDGKYATVFPVTPSLLQVLPRASKARISRASLPTAWSTCFWNGFTPVARQTSVICNRN